MTPNTINALADRVEAGRPVRVQLSSKKGWRMPKNTVRRSYPHITHIDTPEPLSKRRARRLRGKARATSEGKGAGRG